MKIIADVAVTKQHQQLVKIWLILYLHFIREMFSRKFVVKNMPLTPDAVQSAKHTRCTCYRHTFHTAYDSYNNHC